VRRRRRRDNGRRGMQGAEKNGKKLKSNRR